MRRSVLIACVLGFLALNLFSQARLFHLFEHPTPADPVVAAERLVRETVGPRRGSLRVLENGEIVRLVVNLSCPQLQARQLEFSLRTLLGINEMLGDRLYVIRGARPAFWWLQPQPLAWISAMLCYAFALALWRTSPRYLCGGSCTRKELTLRPGERAAATLGRLGAGAVRLFSKNAWLVLPGLAMLFLTGFGQAYSQSAGERTLRRELSQLVPSSSMLIHTAERRGQTVSLAVLANRHPEDLGFFQSVLTDRLNTVGHPAPVHIHGFLPLKSKPAWFLLLPLCASAAFYYAIKVRQSLREPLDALPVPGLTVEFGRSHPKLAILRAFRREMAARFGFLLEEVHCKQNLSLAPDRIRILIGTRKAYEGGDELQSALARVVIANLPELFTFASASDLLERQPQALRMELDSRLDRVQVWKILQGLLAERVSIRNLTPILQSLLGTGRADLERVRLAIRHDVLSCLPHSSEIWHVSQEIEDRLEALPGGGPIAPILEEVASQLDRVGALGRNLVLVTAPRYRTLLRDVVSRKFPDVPVLSSQEIG